MDLLKKFFPYSTKITDTSNFVIKIILHVVAILVGGTAIEIISWICSFLPATVFKLVNIILSLASSLVYLYGIAGIVILVLVFCKVIK